MSRGGRRRGRAHVTVESCHTLSAWGLFQWAQHGEGENDTHVEWEPSESGKGLIVTSTRDGETWRQEIYFYKTPCRFGGRRDWFECPLCHRRVGKLYLPTCIVGKDGLPVNLWLCRHCYDLTYAQRQARDLYWCYLWRADRLAERWLGEFTKDLIYKRKWQHWKTFQRRADQYETLNVAASQFASRSFGRLSKRLRL